MKRRELVRRLEEMGCVLVRHGGSHDWYTNPVTKKSKPVPRHNENQRASGEIHHPEAQ